MRGAGKQREPDKSHWTCYLRCQIYKNALICDYFSLLVIKKIEMTPSECATQGYEAGAAV